MSKLSKANKGDKVTFFNGEHGEVLGFGMATVVVSLPSGEKHEYLADGKYYLDGSGHRYNIIHINEEGINQ